jgi:hypothetical protein
MHRMYAARIPVQSGQARHAGAGRALIRRSQSRKLAINRRKLALKITVQVNKLSTVPDFLGQDL